MLTPRRRALWRGIAAGGYDLRRVQISPPTPVLQDLRHRAARAARTPSSDGAVARGSTPARRARPARPLPHAGGAWGAARPREPPRTAGVRHGRRGQAVADRPAPLRLGPPLASVRT